MMKRNRVVALGMSIGMGLTAGSAGCGGHSGATLLLGTATTVLGGFVVADTKPWNPDEEGVNSMVGTVGGAVMLGGAVLMIAGLVGLASEPRPDEVSPMSSPSSQGLIVRPPSSSPYTSPPRASSGGQREEKIAVHIRLAARANRCDAARFMMKQLGARDYELAQSLRLGDEHVARCEAMTAGTTLAPGTAPAMAPTAPASTPTP